MAISWDKFYFIDFKTIIIKIWKLWTVQTQSTSDKLMKLRTGWDTITRPSRPKITSPAICSRPTAMDTEKFISLKKMKKTKLSSDSELIRSFSMTNGILEVMRIWITWIPTIVRKSSWEDWDIFTQPIRSLDQSSSLQMTTTNHSEKSRTSVQCHISSTSSVCSQLQSTSPYFSLRTSNQVVCIMPSLITTEDGRLTLWMISFQFMKRAVNQSGVWTLNNLGNLFFLNFGPRETTFLPKSINMTRPQRAVTQVWRTQLHLSLLTPFQTATGNLLTWTSILINS